MAYASRHSIFKRGIQSRLVAISEAATGGMEDFIGSSKDAKDTQNKAQRRMVLARSVETRTATQKKRPDHTITRRRPANCRCKASARLVAQ